MEDLFEGAMLDPRGGDEGSLRVHDRRRWRLRRRVVFVHGTDDDAFDDGGADDWVGRVENDVVVNTNSSLTRMTRNCVDSQGGVGDRLHFTTMTDIDWMSTESKVRAMDHQVGTLSTLRLFSCSACWLVALAGAVSEGQTLAPWLS